MFEQGSSELANLLAAGQAGIFISAAGQDREDLKAKGAPVDWVKKEGILDLVVSAHVKSAPNPNAAKLFLNWILSEEGQKAISAAGRIPARPGVAPPGGLLPDGVKWMTSVPEIAKDTPENLKTFNEVLKLR